MNDQIIADGKNISPCLLRRILWWIWVIFLSLLLAVSLIFAAPWKFITLVAIFLAAATILPKIYRKWFWRCVGTVFLALTIWVFLPEDNEGWRPYTFDKELAELQARYAIPDSENAAVIYNQIFENWKQKEANEPNVPESWYDIALKEQWLSKNHPQFAAYIHYHRDVIEKLLQATNFERCSFPIVFDIFMLNQQLEQLSATSKWANLLTTAGNNDLAEGYENKSLEKYLAVLYLGQHLTLQPNMGACLHGFNIECRGLNSIGKFVIEQDTNESCLRKIEQEISRINHDYQRDLRGFIETDKLMLKNMFGPMWYECNAEGRTRLRRDPVAILKKQTQPNPVNRTADDYDTKSSMQTLNKQGYWQKIISKATVIPKLLYVPATPKKLSELVDAEFAKCYLIANFDIKKPIKTDNSSTIPAIKLNPVHFVSLFSQINRDVYLRFRENYSQIAFLKKGTLLVIGLKRYKHATGQWPEKLEDIKNLAPSEIFIDPINDNSFVYKRTDESFMLYSKGQNGIDEGGKGNCNTRSQDGEDDLIIWPATLKFKCSIK